MKIGHLIAALVAATAVLPAASASATTFCVPSFHAACLDNGTNVAEANLETAAGTNGFDGIADRVVIAPGHTYTGLDPFTPVGTDALQITGGGPTSIITSTSTINEYVVYLYNRPTDVSDLKVVIPASMPSFGGAALISSAGSELVNVDVESKNDTSTGALLVGGSTWTGGHFYGTSGGTIGTAIGTNGAASGPIEVSGLLIENSTTGISSTSSNAGLTVRNSRVVNPLQTAVSAQTGGNVTIENSIIQANNGVGLSAIAATSSPVSLTARHVTVVRTGADGGSSALYAQVTGAGSGAATIDVTDSIIRGFGQLYYRSAPTSVTTGDANITLGYTNATGGATANTGDGALTLDTGVISFDPQFESTSDFRLKPGSPSIDKGDPAAGLTTDFLGALRPVDGDGNGSAIRDQGAYEYQPPAPPSSAGGSSPSGPAPTGTGGDLIKPVLSAAKFGKVTYKRGGALKLSLSEPAALTIKLKRKKAKAVTVRATGKQGANTIKIKAKKLKPGTYTGTVVATDGAGNASTPRLLKLKVAR